MSLGKWILGGLGFVVGGPIGALIGVFIASMLDESKNTLNNTESTRTMNYGRRRATQGDISVSIIVLLACVIKADGRVLKAEINYIKPFLLRTFGEEQAKQALALLKQLLNENIDPVAVSRQMAQYINYSTRLELVRLLLEVSNSDGDIAPQELNVIEIIATNMAVQQADYHSLLALYQRHKDVNWAYTALEISPSATNDEVKKAYRRMAMKYHPDKVANAGEELRKQATDKFRGINEAYEHIKKQRGM
jgi:DnaJ like chaperone protein